MPLNSMGWPSLRQRLRVEKVTEAMPEGNCHWRLELDAPAVREPMQARPGKLGQVTRQRFAGGDAAGVNQSHDGTREGFELCEQVGVVAAAAVAAQVDDPALGVRMCG